MSEKKLVKKEVVVEQSPAMLIQQAVKGGADLEKLQGLLDLQMKWEANEAKKAYVRAMTAFKVNPPKIEKDKLVAYKEVKYSHASLANVTEKINKALSDHGLSASWQTKQNGQVMVTCKITHELGHSEETTLSAGADTTGSKNTIQAIGSTITYLQRYTLLALTGLATFDMDNDGQGEIEYITEEQQGVLYDIINGKGVNEKAYLKLIKAESIEKIPAKNYDLAIKQIKLITGGK